MFVQIIVYKQFHRFISLMPVIIPANIRINSTISIIYTSRSVLSKKRKGARNIRNPLSERIRLDADANGLFNLVVVRNRTGQRSHRVPLGIRLRSEITAQLVE